MEKEKPLMPHTTSLTYQGDMSIEQSIAFYKETMEIDGWEIQDFSTNEEGLLFCNKINKRCALSIRTSEQISAAKHHFPQTNVRIMLQTIMENVSPPLYASRTANNNLVNDPHDAINTKKINLS